MTTTSEATLGGVDPAVHSRRHLVLATMCLSLVLIVATVSSVNVAIPSLAGGLSPTPSDTQVLWIVDAYALVFAALLLPAGAIGDRFGRKGALLTGLAIFAVASGLCALTVHPNLLIACRAVMGVGAALIMPSTLSLLTSAFTPQERPKAIAIWAGFAGAGGALGPVMGGFLLDHFWFGSVFLVATPIAAIAFVASAAFAPRSRQGAGAPLDPIGALLSIVGFAALLLAIIEGPERGWTDTVVIAGFVLAAAGLTGFVVHERRSEEPMLDLSYFSDRRFAAGTLGITLGFLTVISMFFTLTQYLQYVRGYSPFEAGLRQVPFAATMVVVSPRSAGLVVRFGARRVVLCGTALLTTGLALLSLVDLDTPYPAIALPLIAMAAGIALSMPPLSTGILQSVPQRRAGVGSAVNDTTREVGGAIGIAVVGSVTTSIYRDRLEPALRNLPADLADVARDNVAKALGVAAGDGGPDSALGVAVRTSFAHGARLGLRVGAATALVSLALLAWRMPGRAEHPTS